MGTRTSLIVGCVVGAFVSSRALALHDPSYRFVRMMAPRSMVRYGPAVRSDMTSKAVDGPQVFLMSGGYFNPGAAQSKSAQGKGV